MIVTDLAHLPKQLRRSDGFEKGIAFLRRQGWRAVAQDVIEIDGARVFAKLQRYETQIADDSPNFEGHRKYIDIQYIAEGTETIFWSQIDSIKVTVPYDDANDIWFGTRAKNETTSILLAPGQLAVFFPDDAHATRLTQDSPAQVKKVMVKVAVDA